MPPVLAERLLRAPLRLGVVRVDDPARLRRATLGGRPVPELELLAEHVAQEGDGPRRGHCVPERVRRVLPAADTGHQDHQGTEREVLRLYPHAARGGARRRRGVVEATRPKGTPPRPRGPDAGQGMKTEMKKGGLWSIRLPPDFFSAIVYTTTNPQPQTRRNLRASCGGRERRFRTCPKRVVS